MPPAGAPRPDAASYDRVATFLESELDRVEAAQPHLGKLPLAHRLSRTEYRNAVRDLLALESLPSEVSIDYLLPADNISSGFDNIADLLFVSPGTMERYLDAARKISRLAVGDPAMPVMVNIHKLDPEHPQDERVDDLPFGTRGGIAVRSEFPVDGTYIVKVDVGAAQGHELEIRVDGERVALRALGGGRGGRRWMRRRDNPIRPIPIRRLRRSIDRQCRAEELGPVDAARFSRCRRRPRWRSGSRRCERVRSEFPLTLKAGPKLIGVAFVQRTEARDEATLRPRMRSRGTQPAINSVTISGPYNATGAGDSPSRRRIFVCGLHRRPRNCRARDESCRRSRAARIAARSNRRGRQELAAVLRTARWAAN